MAIRAIAILIQPESSRSKAFLTLSAGCDQLLALLKGPPGGRYEIKSFKGPLAVSSNSRQRETLGAI